MLAAAFSVSWVDVLVVLLVVVGVMHGRKRGMSEEFLDVLKWTSIVIFAAVLYGPAGRWLTQISSFNSLSAYLFSYVLVALAVFLVFSVIRDKIGEKLIAKDMFGGAEYPLGMMAGAYRYLCILLVALAFLNARHYSGAEIAAADKYQDYNFGTKMFPTIPDLQSAVFSNSFTGRAIHGYLPVVLIRSTPAAGQGVPGAKGARARRSGGDEVLDKK